MHILLPLDLTRVSLNSLDYAMKRFPQSRVTILHVISGISNINYPYHLQTGINYDKAIGVELENILKEHLGVKEIPARISIDIKYGEPVSMINSYSKEHSIDAIVMGLRDKHDQLDKIFGTVSLGVVKRCAIPVFVIPKFAKYKRNTSMMVASNRNIDDEELFMAIDYWNQTNAKVKFLYIQEDDGDEEYVHAKKAIVENMYEGSKPLFSYSIEKVKDRKIGESLLAKAYNDQVDLLVVVTRKASFIQSLFIQSTSKELLLKTKIPILFLHQSKE